MRVRDVLFGGSLALCCMLCVSENTDAADTLLLSRQQAEQIFIQKNLSLIAEKLNVEQAEAMVIQAKLWPNPSLSIDEVNLWATPKQLSMGEELPPLFGDSFGRNRQVSIELEQVLLTAGKRRKLVAFENIGKEIASVYYEELLRNLKVELRNSLTQLQYLQNFQTVFGRQISETQQLLRAYQRQLSTGNIERAEVVRLKALVIELRHEQAAMQKEIYELQKELVVLLALPSDTYLLIEDEDLQPEIYNPEQYQLAELLSKANEKRPDLLVSGLESDQFEKLFAYERANRVPDLALKAGYDRGGNFLYNFIGFGIGIDLPLFNRNQGNIKYAQIGMEKAGFLQQEKQRHVEAEVIQAFLRLSASFDLYQSVEPDYESELDQMLGSYTSNFINRNVGMLEFLDFLDAYLTTKKNILEAKRELIINFEELKFAVGSELE